MADAAISFAVEKLGDALIHKVNFLMGVEDEVRWLKDELQIMQCFLKDEYGNLISKWISDVREVAQDAEDVIEIFTLKLDRPTRIRDHVRKWVGFPVHVSHLNRVGKEIESIRTRLQEIRERRETYGIGNLGEESSSRSKSEMVAIRRRMAARLQKEKDVVGLNDDADLLLNKVILDEERKGLSLAAIVGMGGIGKSTLAWKIYNHPDIVARFKKRAWAVVSSEFAVEDIMKQIMHDLSAPLNDEELKTLESIDGKLRRQEMLQKMLRNRLEGICYFIVLDDVWEDEHWQVLKYAFPDEQGKASRLLFTSRNQILSEHREYVHKMKLLNSDESWELLSKTAFNEGRCPQELEEIGREMLKRCHGLPLAITVAGGLLENQRRSKGGWDRVLKQIRNYHSETSEIGKNVSAILELSYHNLPSHLKPCFLCLAFFKEDEVIRVIRLVHIWVALGLVQAGEGSVEEMAMSYLEELINRNLVQAEDMAVDDRVKYCHVHDLLRELSIRKAKEEISFESLIYNEDEGSSSSKSASSHKPRHRVVRCMGERMIMIDSSNQKKHLRSLFSHIEGPNDLYLTSPSYWESFELLRILDIEGSKFERFPHKVRALIGLRYLRLSEVLGYLRLPSWLDVLKNLEVLDIAECKLVTFPDVTWKMDSLRHFYINSRCNELSNSMKKSSWNNLETLKYVRSNNLLSDNQGQGFSHRLSKLGVELVSGKEGEAEMGRLLAESVVQVLHIRCPFWRECRTLPIPNSLDHLTKLKLEGPIFLLPTADKFPKTITHLTLSQSCINGKDAMQELGKMPNLVVLKLDHDVFTHQLIGVSNEGFIKLELLRLRELTLLSYIEIEEGGMPELQRLELDQCRYLKNIDSLRERIRPAEIIVIAH